jgi:hypothetical protein
MTAREVFLNVVLPLASFVVAFFVARWVARRERDGWEEDGGED